MKYQRIGKIVHYYNSLFIILGSYAIIINFATTWAQMSFIMMGL